VVDHRFGIGRVGTVAFGPSERRAPIGAGARRGNAKGSGCLRRLCRLATGKRERQHPREQNRREALDAGGRFGTDRASHLRPRRGPQTGSGNKVLTLRRSYLRPYRVLTGPRVTSAPLAFPAATLRASRARSRTALRCIRSFFPAATPPPRFR